MANEVSLVELFLSSMESHISSDVYLAGEQLNMGGNYGGFNLHWAWTSDMAVDRNVAMTTKGENI